MKRASETLSGELPKSELVSSISSLDSGFGPKSSTMALTRMLGRLCLGPQPAALAARSLSTAAALTSSSSSGHARQLAQQQQRSRGSLQAHSKAQALTVRSYATEASHLGNLSPHPGSAQKVSRSRSLSLFWTLSR